MRFEKVLYFVVGFLICYMMSSCTKEDDFPTSKNEESFIHLVVNSDGTTSTGAVFTDCGNNQFYIDDILYAIVDNHLEICGRKRTQADCYGDIASNKQDTLKLISRLTYKNKSYDVLTIRGYIFQGSSYKTIILPQRLESIREGGFAFSSNLETIILPSSLKQLGFYTFRECISLKSIEIPSNIKIIEDYLFDNCTNLETIVVPNSVKEIHGGAFYDCKSLKSVNIPNGVEWIYPCTFYGCSSLKSIDIPNTVRCIDGNAFVGCSGLTSLNLPSNIGMGSAVFRGCSGLTELRLPLNMPITSYMFADCYNLRSVIIPNTVKEIGECAFIGCTSLTSVSCLATTPPTMDINHNRPYEKLAFSIYDTLHVVPGCKEAYSNANEWKKFKTIIEDAKP